MNISPAKAIPLLFADGDASDRARVTKFAAQISFLARTETPQWIEAGADEPAAAAAVVGTLRVRSEEHTSELQSLMRISYAVFCLKKKKTQPHTKKARHR